MLSNNLEQSQTIKILYIEDDPSFSNLVRIFLEQKSYNVYSFVTKETLAEGLEVLQHDDDISITLLDLNLPDSRGLNSLLTVRKKFPNQNIIVLTGQNDESLGLKAVQLGAQDYLIKGEFDNRGLVKSIQYAIERSATANRLAEAQRIAKIGNWISIPETDYFYMSPVSYKLFGLEYANYQLDFEEIKSPTHPFFPLLELEDEVVNRRKLRKEIPIKWPNGVTRYLSILCELSLSTNGSYVFNGVLQDITEQKRSEELRKARDIAKQDTKFREKIFTDLSQEINNPVRGILGICQLLNQETLCPTQQSFINSIQQSAYFLNKTISQFITRGLLNEPKIEKQFYSFHELLESVKTTFTSTLTKKGSSIELIISDRINWEIALPQNLFKQVLFIIINQAAKQAQSIVKITADLIEEQGKIAKIQLLISDDGVPFTQKKQGHLLFEDITKPEMSIAKTVLENLGGQIGYYNNPTNSGNVFFMEIVVEKGKYLEQNIPNSNKNSLQKENQINILLIERNPMNQLLLKSTLEQHIDNVIIFIASNTKEALDLSEKEVINLVLLDMEGEKKEIFDITSHFEKHATTMPIIALSSVDYTNHQGDLKNYGLDDFILKPYDPEQLIEKILFYTNIVS